jgi:putative transposase
MTTRIIAKILVKNEIATYSKHDDPAAPNFLAIKFDVFTPDKYWVGDITHITAKNGWLYLAGGD